MNVNLNKRDLVRLCKSTEIPYGGDNDILTEFCGNQWNEDWKWKSDAFSNMTETELLNFYKNGGLAPLKPNDPKKAIFHPTNWNKKILIKFHNIINNDL